MAAPIAIGVVDALVSNTSEATLAGSIPAPGTKGRNRAKKDALLLPFFLW
jgi:hypothetical protein